MISTIRFHVEKKKQQHNFTSAIKQNQSIYKWMGRELERWKRSDVGLDGNGRDLIRSEGEWVSEWMEVISCLRILPVTMCLCFAPNIIIIWQTQTFLPSSHQFMHDSDKRAYWLCFGRITYAVFSSLNCDTIDRHHSIWMDCRRIHELFLNQQPKPFSAHLSLQANQ